MAKNKSVDTEETRTEIFEISLDGIIPPPIYGGHLTTKPENATLTHKLAKRIYLESDFVWIEDFAGGLFTVPISQVHYFRVVK